MDKDKANAIAAARDYLIENVGNMVGPGEAYFDIRDKAWVVSVVYQDPIRQVNLGELKVDGNSGVVSAPSRRELLESFERQTRAGLTVVIQVEHLDKDTVEVIKQLGNVKSLQYV